MNKYFNIKILFIYKIFGSSLKNTHFSGIGGRRSRNDLSGNLLIDLIKRFNDNMPSPLVAISTIFVVQISLQNANVKLHL